MSFFAERVYVVTGSTRGIGRAITDALCLAGARVVVNGRDQDAVRDTVAELGASAVGVAGSVDADAVLVELVDTAVRRFGRLDGLVNNVGVNLFLGPLLDIPERRWRRTLQVNTWAPLRLAQLAARRGLGAEGGGGVLNVSTIGARRVEPGIGAYCASKAALEVVTRVLAVELGEHGVRVNAVAPGMIPTETSGPLLAAPGRAAELAAARPGGRAGRGPAGQAPRHRAGRRRGRAVPVVGQGFLDHRRGSDRGRRRAGHPSLSGEDKHMRLDSFGAFMAEHVYPNETALAGPGADEVLGRLRERAKEAGLWAPNLPRELGGMGLSFLENTLVNEVIGRSLFGPEVFGTQAPDSGNAELLQLYGTPEQCDRWLKPLAAGEIWSAFSMTEPAVSGSDPTGIRTSARRDGDSWVIDGHKWFTSGGSRAAVAIVMCVTEPEAEAHRRASMILVPTDTPGFTVVRDVPVMGTTGGAHSEIRYESCRVPAANLLGERGAGFHLAQRRLGPGRIQHTMRWLGQMQRAFDLMCERALGRSTRGRRLADMQVVQEWIATAAADIQAARLLTMRAANAIDQGRDARAEISMIKFWGARVLVDVIDKAIQVHGALGVSGDTPLELMYRRARAARIYDGADEVHKQVVARSVLRHVETGRPWSFA